MVRDGADDLMSGFHWTRVAPLSETRLAVVDAGSDGRTGIPNIESRGADGPGAGTRS
jgi:hypothetical protein